MNKTEFIESVSVRSGLPKGDVKRVYEAAVDAITDTLEKGDKLALLGFGTFSVTERPAREGINPATKQKIQIAAKKVVKFKAGSDLADKI